MDEGVSMWHCFCFDSDDQVIHGNGNSGTDGARQKQVQILAVVLTSWVNW